MISQWNKSDWKNNLSTKYNSWKQYAYQSWTANLCVYWIWSI